MLILGVDRFEHVCINNLDKFSLDHELKRCQVGKQATFLVFCGYHYNQKWDGLLEFSYPKATVIVIVHVPSNRLFSIIVDDSSPNLSRLKHLRPISPM
jgi:hypothetical protein